MLTLIGLFKKKTREDEVIEQCGCVCYCPSCKDILNDQADCTYTDFVRYKCNMCGTKSKWSFDIFPVPYCFGVEE